MFYGFLNEAQATNKSYLIKPNIKIFGISLGQYSILLKDDIEKEKYISKNKSDAKIINNYEDEAKEKAAKIWSKLSGQDVKASDIVYAHSWRFDYKNNTYSLATAFKGYKNNSDDKDKSVKINVKVQNGKANIKAIEFNCGK